MNSTRRSGRQGFAVRVGALALLAASVVSGAWAARREAKPLPSLPSDGYAPALNPTLRTGVLTMSMAVLDLLRK